MSARLTEAEVRAMLARAEKASGDRWQDGVNGNANVVWFDGEDVHPIARVVLTDDRRFIISARADVPRLAREVLALMGERNQWRHVADEAVAFSDVVVKERDEARADVLAAAGDLMIDVPEPGTNMAKVMLANVAIRRERDEARAVLRDVQTLLVEQFRSEHAFVGEIDPANPPDMLCGGERCETESKLLSRVTRALGE